ncbi:MAG: hypothetical protein ACKOUS_06965 [Alphaproteobacteria bacterium]
MTAASPFPLSPESRRPARIAIFLALALHVAVPVALVVLAQFAAPHRNEAGPSAIEVEIAQADIEEPAPREPEPQKAGETAQAPAPPPAPPRPELALRLDPPKPMLERAPIGDVSRAAPGPDAEPAPSPPATPASEPEPARAEPPQPPEPSPATTTQAAPDPPADAPPPGPAIAPEPPRQEATPPQQQPRQQQQKQPQRQAERKPEPAKPPEAGKARIDGPTTGGRGRDAQRSTSSSEARQQSEGDFVLAQVVPLWLVDKRSPRFRNVVLGGVFMLQADGMLAAPFGKHDPWRPEVMIENYQDLLKPQAAPVRVARGAQPFELPPGVRGGYPRPIRITIRMGDL